MPTYDVFFSHADADEPEVETLAQKLRENEGLRVFFAQWELVPGTVRPPRPGARPGRQPRLGLDGPHLGRQ